MDKIDPIFFELDRLIRRSRLKEIEFIMSMDVSERVHGMTAALDRLYPGAYLLGTGPSTVGIIPLETQDVILGRPPTVLETPTHDGADYCAMDTLYFVPREISRTHAKIVRQADSYGVRHLLFDLHSTCGTFVNETPVDPDGTGIVLKHGDIVSLGPSQASTYVYFRAQSARSSDEGTPGTHLARPYPSRPRPAR